MGLAHPLFCSFSLQFIFSSEQPFYVNYSTLDSHTNTVISHSFAFSRQDGVENRDKVYWAIWLKKEKIKAEIFGSVLKSHKIPLNLERKRWIEWWKEEKSKRE